MGKAAGGTYPQLGVLEVETRASGLGCGYVSARIPEDTAAKILSWCGETCGRKSHLKEPERLHCTVMYDARDPAVSPHGAPERFDASIAGVLLVGPHQDALALALSSDALVARHAELRAVGMRHGYAPYKPHVTLIGSGASVTDLARARAGLPELRRRVGGVLVLGPERWRACPVAEPPKPAWTLPGRRRRGGSMGPS